MQEIKNENLTWLDINQPTDKDINYLKETYHFHHLILEELIPPSQRSRVEQYDDTIYLVLYFPVYNQETRETKLRELDIVAGENILVTSHYETILPHKELFDRSNLYEAERRRYMQSSGKLLYYIIDNLLSHLLPKLDNIAKKIDLVEAEIFKGREKEMLLEISLIRRDILNMSKAIKPQGQLLRSLNKLAPARRDKRYQIYFNNLLSSHAYVKNILNSHQEMINALADTNASLLSFKLNEIVKILTILSFIAFPLSIIAGIFSMNIQAEFTQLPPLTFWIIISFMALISMAMTIFFKKKKWL